MICKKDKFTKDITCDRAFFFFWEKEEKKEAWYIYFTSGLPPPN